MGGMEAKVEATIRDLEERDKRYDERAQAQNKAVETAIIAQEKAVTAALAASEKAVDKAEANSEKWRENANEWRGAMNDRDRELPSRKEVESNLKAIGDRLISLEQKSDLRMGGEVAVDKAATVAEKITDRSLTVTLAIVGFGIVFFQIIVGIVVTLIIKG
jgi:hypothetical protein